MSENITLKMEEAEKIELALQNAMFINRNNIHSDTTANWNAQPGLIAKKDHIYIYTDYTQVSSINIPAMKVGDGNAYLIDLPFVSSGGGSESPRVQEHLANTSIHVSEEDRAFWDNKVTCFTSNDNSEILVFSKESEEN